MHTFITGYDETDHVNHRGLDVRRCNLWESSRSQNMANRRIQSNNTSGFKGVTWDAKASKWQARVKKNYRQMHLGLFVDPTDAARARDHKALELFGEFALSNEKLGLVSHAGCDETCTCKE